MKSGYGLMSYLHLELIMFRGYRIHLRCRSFRLCKDENHLHLKTFRFLCGLRCSISIGMAIGWVCARLLKSPKKLRPHIICCIATGRLKPATCLSFLIFCRLAPCCSLPAGVFEPCP